MDANIQPRYYVYGLGINNASFFHFGVTDKKPEANKQEIYSGFLEREAAQPNTFQIKLIPDAEVDLFELEDFSSLDAAKEAVEFWFGCFQFHGLRLLKGHV